MTVSPPPDLLLAIVVRDSDPLLELGRWCLYGSFDSSEDALCPEGTTVSLSLLILWFELLLGRGHHDKDPSAFNEDD